MATTTPNYSLVKPDFVDVVDISELNGNMDTIDSTMKNNEDAIDVIEGDVTVLQNAVKEIQETTEKTANYTLVIGDAGKIVQMNKSGTATLTVPTNASVAFPTGTIVGVYNRSSDDVTIAGDGGVTVRNDGTVPQYGEISLRKRATDEWVMVGG
jgi:prophage DNA circulation protein